MFKNQLHKALGLGLLSSLLLGASAAFLGCDSSKPAEIEAAWYDVSGAPEGDSELVSAYADVQLPPRPVENDPAITLSLWLKPLFLDAPPPSHKKRKHETLNTPILEGLGLNNLPSPLPVGAAKSRLVSAKQASGYVEGLIQFSDPLFGSWTALLLIPEKQSQEGAAVLALHGHEQEASDIVETEGVQALLKAGVVVLAPNFRAMGCDRGESNATSALYNKGITLMGAEVYETQLMLNYLSSRPKVKADKIGVLAHNAGSAIAHLSLRVGSQVAAFVGDYQSEYKDQECEPLKIHCETLPPLLEDAPSINNLDSLPIAHLYVKEGLNTDKGSTSGAAFLKKELLSTAQ